MNWHHTQNDKLLTFHIKACSYVLCRIINQNHSKWESSVQYNSKETMEILYFSFGINRIAGSISTPPPLPLASEDNLINERLQKLQTENHVWVNITKQKLSFILLFRWNRKYTFSMAKRLKGWQPFQTATANRLPHCCEKRIIIELISPPKSSKEA